WGWLLLGGALGIIAGLLVLQHPLWSAILVPTVVVIYLGIYGIVIGVIHLAEAARGGGWGIGVLGVLGIALGALLLLSPLAAGRCGPGGGAVRPRRGASPGAAPPGASGRAAPAALPTAPPSPSPRPGAAGSVGGVHLPRAVAAEGDDVVTVLVRALLAG